MREKKEEEQNRHTNILVVLGRSLHASPGDAEEKNGRKENEERQTRLCGIGLF